MDLFESKRFSSLRLRILSAAAAAAIPMIPSTFAIADGGRGPWPPFCEEEEEEDEDDDGDQGEKHFSTESEKEEGNRAICCR